ncbi:U3 small nucleolar ribonucleoprotein protein MPP10 [Plutella xylostella]|uniref:U3 small nucleolar ribonucleoprotein protein MPP10 n=1 Tax=Plutella xylostella TaxID=51655 RepID=UPI0020323B12|nr:U3 small nucleolar ribonucleoprotein protein MPP10 [Plutella xylostella]
MSTTDLENILEKFSLFTQKPVKFLTVQKDAHDDIKNLVKSMYDFTKSQEDNKCKSKASALPDLIVKDFDEEQIWQEIELQNTECWDGLVWEVANSMTAKKDLLFPIKDPEIQSEHDDASEVDGASGNDGELEESDGGSQSEPENDEPQQKHKVSKPKIKSKPSVVDDKFFKLQDMEKFLVTEERKDGKVPKQADSDEESIDMFDEIDSEGSDEEAEEGKDMMYNDFFNNESQEQDSQADFEENDEQDDEQMSEEDEQTPVKKKGKKVSFADKDENASDGSENEDDDDEDKNMSDDGGESEDSETTTNKMVNAAKPEKIEKKSEFEMRQERLQQTITRLENKSLSEAPWQLKGEVDATKRPQNSLLQEVVDFDMTSRPPPVITEQTTITLEDLIKQRVKDKAWDDVVKKEKPTEDVLAFRKPEVLDHSKSKQSLAQVYEAEYLKQKHSSTDDAENENEPEAHKEVREAMNSLFSKLDALCHYHYTPKAAQPEVKIVSNTPAISMEEVAPVAVSDAALLAPEEVKRKKAGELMSKDERTDTDKKRERRKKKKFQQKKGKVEKVTEQRNTKKGVEANTDKSLKTSKAFFQQLNDDTTSLIKSSNAKRKNVKNKGQ